jgi:D-alanyl-lipoteichoic acid acyltransferase DltB (MBOAT superfamily)
MAGWVGMIGVVMTLHFGTFHLLSCFWRSNGVNARPLMHSPLSSVSLGEFWGRRWNTAFRDLTHRFLFRPLTAKLGARGAVFAGFIFSGLIHDAVISAPAGGGYGGPTLFFVVQAFGMLAERSRTGRRLGLGAGRIGWLFTVLLLVGPAPLLFHPPFVVGIVVPFMQAIGAR